jgi:hypothetical protein
VKTTHEYKIGDLVRMPWDAHYWWSETVGLVIGFEDIVPNPAHRTLKILVGRDKHTRFGAGFVELVSESR